ncbi:MULTISPECIES: GntR family transcriptional regulator [unclassified Streptomyces]|uniref:GntR family transcriptional regulator n=1 Tax=unclassified Streptomyces TaxID=2593676 RepID=UPI0037F5549C
MKHSAQGAAGTGAGAHAGAGRVRTAGAVRIPVQPGAADRARDRAPGGGEPDGAARGEHTHGEPPVPRPRTLVRRSSVRGQILDALRSALASGELRPGGVYSAPVLGERFGVSATPVREAMQQLALEGAVEVVPNRGFRVVERGDRELAELAEVRALIEAPVWIRLSRTVPAERWAELRPLAEATVRAASSGCPATYAEADRAFHRAVLALAGNEQLVRIAGDVHRRAQWPPAGSPSVRGRADLVADAHEHTALLDALIAGDADAVRTLIDDHFTAGH